MATQSPPAPPPKPKYNKSHPPHSDLVQNNNHLNTNNNNSLPPEDEQVVMTPRGKTATSTVLLIERKLIAEVGDRTHIAGGEHRGIVINKDQVKDQKSVKTPPQLSLEFRVFLVSANTGQHSQESRTLRFWYRDWLRDGEVQAHVAQNFFRELVTPQEFPRDYVGFIKKIMKLLQRGYNEIQAVEIELRILEQTSAPPSRPRKFDDPIFVLLY